MKRTIRLIAFCSVAGAFALTFSLNSCNKEQQPGTTPLIKEKTKTDKNGSQGNEKIAMADGTVSVSGICGTIKCNTQSTAGPSRYNMMTFTKDALTAAPGTDPNLRYAVYVYGGLVAGVPTYYIVGTQFTCTNNPTKWGDPLLLNSTTYYLAVDFATSATYPSYITYNTTYGYFNTHGKVIPFTTGTEKGASGCGGVGIGG